MNPSLPWSDTCKLSLVHPSAFPQCAGGGGPVLDTLQQAAGLHFFDGFLLSPPTDPQEAARLAQALPQTGLEIGVALQGLLLDGRFDINSTDLTRRRLALSVVEDAIHRAAALGASRVVIISGPDPLPEQRPAALDLLAASLLRLCRFASAYPLTVLLEVCARSDASCSLIGPPAEAVFLAETVLEEYDNFGLLYNASLPGAAGPGGSAANLADLTILLPYLSELHLSECLTPHPTRPCLSFTDPQEDTRRLAGFLQTLFQLGWLQPIRPADQRPRLGFDIRPQPGQAPLDLLHRIQAAWRRAWLALPTRA